MNEKFIWHEGDLRLYHKDVKITAEQLAKANERIDDFIESIENQKETKNHQSDVKTRKIHTPLAHPSETSKMKKPA